MSDGKPTAIEKAAAGSEATEPAEFESTEAEFRKIFEDCEATRDKMLKIANRMAARNSDAADVLRQVINNIIPLLSDVVAACGGAFDAVESQVDMLEESAGEGGGEGLSEDDAVDFYRVVTADLHLINQAIEASSGGEQRTALEALRDMNKQMLERVCELSDMEDEEIAKLASEPPSTEQGEDEDDEDEEDEPKVN
jgi:hypothetical protein